MVERCDYNQAAKLTLGLSARPVLVLTGLPHTCSSFWIMLAALVWALQLIVATAVPCTTQTHSVRALFQGDLVCDSIP